VGKKVTLASNAVQGCMIIIYNTLYCFVLFEINETQIKILEQQFFQKTRKYDYYSYQEFAFEVDYKF